MESNVYKLQLTDMIVPALYWSACLKRSSPMNGRVDKILQKHLPDNIDRGLVRSVLYHDYRGEIGDLGNKHMFTRGMVCAALLAIDVIGQHRPSEMEVFRTTLGGVLVRLIDDGFDENKISAAEVQPSPQETVAYAESLTLDPQQPTPYAWKIGRVCKLLQTAFDTASAAEQAYLHESLAQLWTDCRAGVAYGHDLLREKGSTYTFADTIHYRELTTKPALVCAVAVAGGFYIHEAKRKSIVDVGIYLMNGLQIMADWQDLSEDKLGLTNVNSVAALLRQFLAEERLVHRGLPVTQHTTPLTYAAMMSEASKLFAQALGLDSSWVRHPDRVAFVWKHLMREDIPIFRFFHMW